VRPGFDRKDLKPRYDVSAISEDDWHAHSGLRTARLLAGQLARFEIYPRRLLNAGAGCYQLRLEGWSEISLDLFAAPISRLPNPVCASIEQLPFQSEAFGCVICVGEVLAYCDPATAIAEFARVLVPSGMLICDFGNSRSFRYRFTNSFGRAAHVIHDHYNGSSERVWVYNPGYIRSLLEARGFEIKYEFGTHTWSALVRRLGTSSSFAVALEKKLSCIRLPISGADLTTFVAVRQIVEK
jgi:SAM-dependent methyltransferase